MRGLFAEVAVAFLACPPDPADAARALKSKRVYVVPLMMSEGYLSASELPRRLAALGTPRRFVHCPPVGVHPGFCALMERRVDAECATRGWDARTTRVLLAAHGARHDAASRRATQAHEARLAATGRYAGVASAFVEEAPSVDTALAACDGNVVVVGMFAAAGRHPEHDVPEAIAAGQARRTGAVAYTGPIGADPGLVELILDRVAAAAELAAACA